MAVNSGRIFYLCLFGLLFFVEKHEVNSVFCLNLVKYIYTHPQPISVQRGNAEYSLESLDTRCDHDFVEYFHRVPDSKILYTFRVVKLAPAFTISITIKVLKTHRIMYKIENFKGCEFLNNPVIFKMFGESYKTLVVNGSYFKCPIKPKVYYLKTDGIMSMIPGVHPFGRFQLSMRVKMKESRKPFVMEMLLNYTIVRIK
ncbi:LOW QUALITY PROTEIN: uncharacterized protein LOC27206420 [Drosophila simulans]